MPLRRRPCVFLSAFAAAALLFPPQLPADGGGGGGGPGPAADPQEGLHPKIEPALAGDAECGEETPAQIAERELCLIEAKTQAYADWTRSVGMQSKHALCGLDPAVLRKWKTWAREAAQLRRTLNDRYPAGMAALPGREGLSELVELDLKEAETGGQNAAAAIGLIADQCSYGQERLSQIKESKALAATQNALGGKLGAAQLDRAFDNILPKNGATPALPQAVPGRTGTPAAGSTPPLARPQPKAPETFESLTAGIVYEPGPKNLSKREQQRREQVLSQALRHIYSIPEGKKVLRDIQAVREEKAAEISAQLPQLIEQAKGRTDYLKELKRAESKLAEKNPPPEPQGGRLLGARNLDTGKIDRVDPHQELSECPPGQRPVRVDFPKPGDKFCREGDDAPGLFLTVENKKGEFDIGEKAERCPDGYKAVLTMHPNAGDRACRPPDNPDTVKSIGPGPYHYVATDNPFMPFQIWDKCPARSEPVISNWPRPGDISCMGPGSFGTLAQVKEKIKTAEQKAAIDKTWLAAADKNPKPRVGVEFGGTGPLEGGHAIPLQYELKIGKDGVAAFQTPIRISEEFLRDRNASRATDKVLVHELRHTADKAIFEFEAAGGSGMRWLLGEDRAYLSQARAVMEQQPAMRRERRSPIVENMKRHLVEPTLRNPRAVRLDKIASPLYLWEVTHADMADPKTGLQGRLEQAYNMVRYTDDKRRADIFAKIDSSGEIQAAYEKTQAAKPDSDISSDDERRALFIKNASSTRLAQRWLDGLERLKGTDPENPPAWKVRFDALENDFWSDLESFTAQYKLK